MVKGMDFHADENDFEKIVLHTAERKTAKATIARFFESTAHITE